MGSILTVIGSILSVLITAGLGTWLAYVWQKRSAKQARYFDASKVQYEQMHASAKVLANAVGKRLYATNRVCLISKSNSLFEQAESDFRLRSVEWNENLLQNELNIRTLFRNARLHRFEELQAKIVQLTDDVSRFLREGDAVNSRRKLLVRTRLLRSEYFSFLEEMIKEADNLFNQMHFGVVLKYDENDIEMFSTLDLFKVMFQGPDDESAVLRSPSDFGLPVGSGYARLGIYKH